MIAIVSIAIITAMALVSCARDESHVTAQPSADDVVKVGLHYSPFGPQTRDAKTIVADYDLVQFLIADHDGFVIDNMKGYYDYNASSLFIEGLQPGEYTLLIAGVKGDWMTDGVTFEDIVHSSETWLKFDDDITKALSAEYFYSATDFTVSAVQGANGLQLVTDLPAVVEQKRIVGRMDVGLMFDNPYLADAIISADVVMHFPVFYTEMSADGQLSGETPVDVLTLDLGGGSEYLLLPTVGEGELDATVEVLTRNYLGERIHRSYSVTTPPVMPNHINTVTVEVIHPEDGNGTMFITDEAYKAGNHPRILQDDEHHSVYTDQNQRMFNTAQPMQASVTEDGRLSVRFYSPKPVGDVLLRARIPSVSDDYIDLAYFDTIPAFADFSAELPAISRQCVYRTESGKIVKLPQLTADELRQSEFRILSTDPYWAKLQDIKHGWTVRFALYGGDPTKPDGGPSGNWMGIRPVHCREVVAFFLNFTYMIDMPEHEEILRANEDRLYGNGGVDDKVTVETVLSQMRQKRSIRVGLVYTGNLVMGLGGGDVFGAYQGGWFEHYTSAYACEVMFHELGHVMGYTHDSSFTYGPWAQELMNNFYISNIAKMPVESPHYLNSAFNPNKY